jgi:hypothetical protein
MQERHYFTCNSVYCKNQPLQIQTANLLMRNQGMILRHMVFGHFTPMYLKLVLHVLSSEVSTSLFFRCLLHRNEKL